MARRQSRDKSRRLRNRQTASFVFLGKTANHSPVTCDKFAELSPTNRAFAARDARICFNCLSDEHRARECQMKIGCKVDGYKLSHHTLLHGAERIFTAQLNVRTSWRPQIGSQVLLMVVPIRVHVGEKSIDTYAMLDSGSDASLIRQDVERRLGLRGRSNSFLFGTFHRTEMIKPSMVSFKISAVDNLFTFAVNNRSQSPPAIERVAGRISPLIRFIETHLSSAVRCILLSVSCRSSTEGAMRARSSFDD